VVRPVGAAIFGHYGDRLGRKAALIATLLLMGLATFAPAAFTVAQSSHDAAPQRARYAQNDHTAMSAAGMLNGTRPVNMGCIKPAGGVAWNNRLSDSSVSVAWAH
jgi:MFS family permease